MEREPLPSPPPAPSASMRGHAMDHLAFIRRTMERAGTFTAVSGKGQVGVGAIALTAAAMASRQQSREAWLGVWLGAAVAAVAVAVTGIVLKARAIRTPILSGPGRRFALGFAPPVVAGAVLTFGLAGAGEWALLPPMWLLVYGAAVVAGGTLSVPPVPVMGGCFMALGMAALLAPSAWGDWWLALGFGFLHVAFGIRIAVKHGG